jgi:hypothetical protein
METITKNITRKPLFITPDAHELLPYYVQLLAEDKGVSSFSYTEAASIAIKKDVRRLEHKKARREKMQAS